MVSYSFQDDVRLWNLEDGQQDENAGGNPITPGTENYIANKLGSTGNTHLSDQRSQETVNDNETDKWPVTEIIRLLRFYAGHRCLWDVEHEDNHNRKMRHAALVDIAAAMGGDLTKEQVVQKINIIRATYRYEKKRIKQRMRMGMGSRTKLKWFALADAFLRNVPKKGHKGEESRNSDSDLEDAVVFTINPETLGPLLGQTKPTKEIGNDVAFQPKMENFTEDTELTNDLENEANCQDMITDQNLKPKMEELEVDLQQQLKNLKEEKTGDYEVKLETLNKDETISNKNNPKIWTLETSLEFIKLLKEYPILCTNTSDMWQVSRDFALESIAQRMQWPAESIKKRWNILRQTVEQERAKMLNDPLYQPPYKWWKETAMLWETPEDIKPETIYLDETKSPLNNATDNEDHGEEDDEDYEKRFENPLPSVAPMSNMNETLMSSLFRDDFSLESNTNSSFPLEMEEERVKLSSKNVLEDDLLEGKWSLKHSVKFLRLYGVHRCLWDLNDPDYRSRPLRNAAIEDIAASMGHGLTPAYVAKKIKIFRITYMQQRKRILEATQRGENPEILLKWFPLADSFLRPHIGLRSIKSDVVETIPQFDFQYVYANLNLIDPSLLNDFRGKGTQNAIDIGDVHNEQSSNTDGE